MSTLDTVHNLGILYRDQGKLKEAEEIYQRVLAGREKALGTDHISTLDTVHNLGILYRDQEKLKKAGEMYQRALAGRQKALGKLKESKEMFQRAYAGRKKALGLGHPSTSNSSASLSLYWA
ncbi:unnamed protein product [Penicillium crustosum]